MKGNQEAILAILATIVYCRYANNNKSVLLLIHVGDN